MRPRVVLPLLVPLAIGVFALSRGSQRVLTALALAHLGPWSTTAYSLVIACAVWLPLAGLRGWLVLDRKLWLRCVPLGLVNIAIPGIAFTAALYVTAASAALLVACLPIAVAVAAFFLLKERLGLVAVGGIAVGTLGVVVLTLGKGGSITGTNWVAGLCLVGLGVLSAACVYVGWRGLLKEYSAVRILGPQLVVSSIVALGAALLIEGYHSPSASTWGLLGMLGVVNYIIPQLAMFYLLMHTTAVRTTLPNYLAPLVATVMAVPLLHQSVHVVLVVGGVLILTGALMVNTAKLRAGAEPGEE
jgi:drug/metabolite transporter (DMT)-like permease